MTLEQWQRRVYWCELKRVGNLLYGTNHHYRSPNLLDLILFFAPWSEWHLEKLEDEFIDRIKWLVDNERSKYESLPEEVHKWFERTTWQRKRDNILGRYDDYLSEYEIAEFRAEIEFNEQITREIAIYG
jgi:hypothetical protein